MRRKAVDIDIENLIVVGAEFISDTEPKTLVGKILRWVKKIVRLKSAIGLKIK